MVAPHPVYRPRGTPISVLNRCRALSALGHDVDLVTYPMGEDVPVRGLTYDRARVPGIADVRVGPSLAKAPLDAAVFARALRRLAARRGDFDVVHTHEEAGALALLARRAFRVPHVYDMGNDLSVVAANYGMPRPAVAAAALAERAVIRHSDVVITHFPSLAARVAAVAPSTPVHVVYNVPFDAPVDPTRAARFRSRWSPDGRPVVVYTGTLERYQGLSLVVGAVEVLARSGTGVHLAVVGGSDAQARELRSSAAAVADLVHVEGAVPHDDVPSALAAADVLVSPRATGTNTPLKIFSYLHSGRPIVATRVASHTQVLSPAEAVLVEPTADGIAEGIRRCVRDPAWAADVARRAQARAEAEFSTAAFVAAVGRAYADLEGAAPGRAAAGRWGRRLAPA
jgi:glycosyltransferase involved in cell wall biosynthesis